MAVAKEQIRQIISENEGVKILVSMESKSF